MQSALHLMQLKTVLNIVIVHTGAMLRKILSKQSSNYEVCKQTIIYFFFASYVPASRSPDFAVSKP